MAGAEHSLASAGGGDRKAQAGATNQTSLASQVGGGGTAKLLGSTAPPGGKRPSPPLTTMSDPLAYSLPWNRKRSPGRDQRTWPSGQTGSTRSTSFSM